MSRHRPSFHPYSSDIPMYRKIPPLLKEDDNNSPIKAVIVDVHGCLLNHDRPLLGASAAYNRLRSTNLPIRLTSNSSKVSDDTVLKKLADIGIHASKDQLRTSISMAATWVIQNNRKPFYMLAPDARSMFPPANADDQRDYDCVIIGHAPDELNIDNMNTAYRILRANAGSAPLIAIHEGRHAGRDGDDVGPGLFARGLEFCAGVPVQVLGSPNEEFFAKSLPKGITPSECVVIADDMYDDMLCATGMRIVVINKSKYKMEELFNHFNPDGIVDNFAKAVEWLVEELEHQRRQN